MIFFVQIADALIWSGIPYLVFLGTKRILQLDHQLNYISLKQIIIIAIAVTIVGDLSYQGFQYFADETNPNEYNFQMRFFAMAFGDFIGIIATLLATKNILRLYKHFHSE